MTRAGRGRHGWRPPGHDSGFDRTRDRASQVLGTARAEAESKCDRSEEILNRVLRQCELCGLHLRGAHRRVGRRRLDVATIATVTRRRGRWSVNVRDVNYIHSDEVRKLVTPPDVDVLRIMKANICHDMSVKNIVIIILCSNQKRLNSRGVR